MLEVSSAKDYKDFRPATAICSQNPCGSVASLGADGITALVDALTTLLSESTAHGASVNVSVDPPRKKKIVIIHGDPSKPNNILPGGKWDEDDFEAVETLKRALVKLEDEYEFSFLSSHDTLIADLQKLSQKGETDLILQLCDEGYMNHPRMEMHVTALLEIFKLPYTGTGASTIGLSYDKGAVLEIARSLGIPIPGSVLVQNDADILSDIRGAGLVYPLFVKPNSTDGSYGVTTKSICRSDADVLEALRVIREVFFVRCPVLVQEFLEGADLNTAVIGNPGSFVHLPATEEDYSEVPAHLPRILGFENKWDENSPYWRVGTVRARSVDAATLERMDRWSARLFERLNLRDYARFDWKLDARGCPRLLEANPNCGWSYDAHLQRMCGLAGIGYSDMLRRILMAAEQRYAAERARGEEKFVSLEQVSAHRCTEKQITPNQRSPLML
jgi:D-alanine-D-alanine ligase